MPNFWYPGSRGSSGPIKVPSCFNHSEFELMAKFLEQARFSCVVNFLPNLKQLEEAELNAGHSCRKKIVFVKMEVIVELRA